jgi:hypothetical protein
MAFERSSDKTSPKKPYNGYGAQKGHGQQAGSQERPVIRKLKSYDQDGLAQYLSVFGDTPAKIAGVLRFGHDILDSLGTPKPVTFLSISHNESAVALEMRVLEISFLTFYPKEDASKPAMFVRNAVLWDRGGENHQSFLGRAASLWP